MVGKPTFIDLALVTKRGISTEEFEQFNVEVTSGHTFPCMQKVLQLNVVIGNYNMTDNLYVVKREKTNVVLGVQWLNTLGTISQNYQTMKMGFNVVEGSFKGHVPMVIQG